MNNRSNRPLLAAAALMAALAFMAAPTPAAAQSACGAYYTLDTGDTLVEVAARCGVTVPALLAANPGVVDQRDIDVGGRLRVPDPGAPQPSPVQACGPSYEIRTGDTLAEIAMKCGLTVPLLVAANGPLPQPLGNHPGVHLRIPDVPHTAVIDPGTLATPGVGVGADVGTGTDTTTDSAPALPDLTRVTGVLEAGPRCTQVRTAAGEVVAIAGELDDAFRPGHAVVLMGIPTRSHDCGPTRALELRILYRPGQ
jgi:LysM repeat protein